jgi:hypothetical protein
LRIPWDTGALFFPRLPEPEGEQQATRVVQRTGKQYIQAGRSSQQVYLYHLEPAMPVEALQRRLHAIFDLAVEALPERPKPVCEGMYLDPNTVNSSQTTLPPNTILCPKRHIGPDVLDLVNANTDCLKNPRLCHVMGQPGIIPPFLKDAAVYEHDE